MKKTAPPLGQNHVVDPTEMVSTEFLLYETEDGETRIDVRMSEETVWLNLMQLTNLFDQSVFN